MAAVRINTSAFVLPVMLVVATAVLLLLTAAPSSVEGSYMTVWDGPGCNNSFQRYSACGCSSINLHGGYELVFQGEAAAVYNQPDCQGVVHTSFGSPGVQDCRAIGWKSIFINCSVHEVPPPPGPAPSPPSTAIDDGGKRGKSRTLLLTIVIVSVVATVVSSLVNTIICLRRRTINAGDQSTTTVEKRFTESLLFDFETLRAATGNFCEANKLGEGGFGPVYMGFLPDGQQIAVKRLSGRSTQGLAELRNEVVLVAKLHHRNLVRVLGFCLEEEEKIVVYEYLPNKSLDKFLFDLKSRLLLDWERRHKLVAGIARGLLYLHEDSRLRIIHRDLKASNILLDEHMNPKISDFGLAKLFASDETHGRTSHIAGTFGYMPPEYVMHGHFSTKLDVFSFGVLILEIVTGRRNSTFDESGNAIDLVSFVWYHWNEGGTVLQVLDPAAGDRYQAQEVLRWIHIGLLCVQEDPSERPNMSEVVLMLSSFSLTLPAPSRPAFVTRRIVKKNSDTGLDSYPGENGSGCSTVIDDDPNRSILVRISPSGQSLNEVTVSDIEPR